jgi:tol-pal system beta propeller repeat protein TolB
VYLLNIETGQREIVGDFPGITFSPRFSPDGQRIIMSLPQDGNSNLFVMDLRSKAITRLTDTPAIDTAPSYSPDGTRICFESDRGRRPQIYVMAANGGPAERISVGESYSTPVWSPRGNTIAFTWQNQGSFAVGVMRPNGHDERILINSYHNVSPNLRAQRTDVDVLPRSRRRRRPRAVHHRPHWPQRIVGADAQLRTGSGLVPAAAAELIRRTEVGCSTIAISAR